MSPISKAELTASGLVCIVIKSRAILPAQMNTLASLFVEERLKLNLSLGGASFVGADPRAR
jgi:hypothetical protein